MLLLGHVTNQGDKTVSTTQKITGIDRSTIKLIRDRIDAALTDLADELGVTIKVGHASYSSSNVTYKVEVATESDDGTANTKDAEAFRLNAKAWGLSPDDLGKTFAVPRHPRTIYKIIGARPQSWKYPILAETQNGKVYKFPASSVKAALAR